MKIVIIIEMVLKGSIMSVDMIDDRLKLDMIDVKFLVVVVSLGEER